MIVFQFIPNLPANHQNTSIEKKIVKIKINSGKSATTSRAGGMRMAPGKGRDHLCWWPLIFKLGQIYLKFQYSMAKTFTIFVSHRFANLRLPEMMLLSTLVLISDLGMV